MTVSTLTSDDSIEEVDDVVERDDFTDWLESSECLKYTESVKWCGAGVKDTPDIEDPVDGVPMPSIEAGDEATVLPRIFCSHGSCIFGSS